MPGTQDGVRHVSYAAPVLGVLGGLVGIADTIPYVRDMVGGSTRPHRGTWLIWGLLAIVACVAQLADGASWSAVMAGTQAMLTGAVFLLAIRYGEGGMSASRSRSDRARRRWRDRLDPRPRADSWPSGCVIAADLIAFAMMVPKVRRDPHSETVSTYALASVGGALATGAVGMVDLSLILYPVYYCLANGAAAILIHQHRSVCATAPR